MSLFFVFLVVTFSTSAVKCNEVPPAKLEERASGTLEKAPTVSQPQPNPVQAAGYPCELSLSQVPVPGFVCKGQLLFEDNFNSEIDKGNIWIPEVRFPEEPDFPFNVYLNDNIGVGDGNLIIRPTTLNSKYGSDSIWQPLDLSSSCTGTLGTRECVRRPEGAQILPPIITAKVTTKQKFVFKYGRVEIRAKMPQGDWLIPEILLEPSDSIYGIQNYASGIMRVACVKGNALYSKTLIGGPIMCDSEPYRSSHLKEKNGNEQWSKDFHNYTLEWRPDGITLFVDEENYGEIKPGKGFYEDAAHHNVQAATQWKQKGTAMAPFDDMFYISLGLDVGGIHEFPDTITNKPWKNSATKAMFHFWEARDSWQSTWYNPLSPSALHIDYVKVFAL